MGLEIMFFDHPVRKQAFLDEKISILHNGQIKGVNPWFCSKIGSLSVILDKWALKLCLMIIQVENKPS